MINPAFALARTLPATMQFRRRFTLAARQLSRVVVQPSSKSSWKLEKGEKSIYLRFDTPEHTRERKFHRSGLSGSAKNRVVPPRGVSSLENAVVENGCECNAV